MSEEKKATRFTCTRCGEGFNLGKWLCADGAKHSVPLKSYYVASNGLTVNYGPVHGTLGNAVRGAITFNRGQYQTRDPEQQEFLDQYAGCIPADQWQEIHLTKKEVDAKKQRERSRLEQDNNELLERVKQLEAEKIASVPAMVSTGSGKKG